jgi:small-conductance mechanosensitive channel
VQDIELLNRQVLGASGLEWITALVTLAGVFGALVAIRHLALRHLSRLAARSSTRADDAAVEIIRRTRLYFFLLIAVYAATRVVPVPPDFARVFRALAIILVLLQVGRWGNALIQVAADHYARQRPESDAGTRATIQAMGYAGRFALWLILLITALQNFGIDVTALVTGLGIGGIAVALAVQNVLGDLLAALAIVLDKPFVVGDFIIVDNTLGTVEHVGLKTTRIRSLSGEQVIIANADLLKSRIHNYKRMEQRRAVFTLDLAFDTPPEKVSAVPTMVRSAVEAQPLTRFDRCHWLTTVPTGIRLESVYFVLDSDYNKYADIQHAINLDLLTRIRDAGIDLGYHARLANLNTADR